MHQKYIDRKPMPLPLTAGEKERHIPSRLDNQHMLSILNLNNVQEGYETEADGAAERAVGATPVSGCEEAILARLSARFGVDASNLRVHNDEFSKSRADSLGAEAYAANNDIYMGGQDMQSLAGQRVFAHELAHTIQQGAVMQSGSEIGGISGGAPAGQPQFISKHRKKLNAFKAKRNITGDTDKLSAKRMYRRLKRSNNIFEDFHGLKLASLEQDDTIRSGAAMNAGYNYAVYGNGKPVGGNININEKIYKKGTSDSLNTRKTKYATDDMDTISHELGHVVANSMRDKKYSHLSPDAMNMAVRHDHRFGYTEDDLTKKALIKAMGDDKKFRNKMAKAAGISKKDFKYNEKGDQDKLFASLAYTKERLAESNQFTLKDGNGARTFKDGFDEDTIMGKNMLDPQKLFKLGLTTGYGGTNIKEMYAEVFAKNYGKKADKKKANPFYKALVDVSQKEYNQLYGITS